MAHTPGRDHRRRSDPARKRRFRKRAARKKAEADKRYEEAKRAWEQMSDEARKLRPELDPELLRPRRRPAD
jgi:predicted  nucleic acid-binding Zn-ribbon protein